MISRMNNSSGRKLTVRTFKKILNGSAMDEIRDEARKEVLAFINEEVGEENLVSLTECRSQNYWECTVWYWQDTDIQYTDIQ